MTRCSELEECALWRVLDVTRQMCSPISLDALLEHVVEAALEVLEADRATVFLYDPKTDELCSKVATGEKEIRFPAGVGIAGESAQHRQVINVPDCYADDRFNPDIDKKTGYRTRCLLTIPMIGHDDKLVGVLQVLNKRQGVFEADDEQVATALAAQCAVALQRAMLIEEHVIKQKLERDLALARDIQMRVLPAKLPTAEGYDLAGWSTPADATGGDIYDAAPLDDCRVALLMGDATGHGIGPALSVTQVRAMFRMALRLRAELDAIFSQVNDQLVDDLPGNRFVTAFIGVLDPATHELTYHAGGQGPLLHYHAATGECEWIEASTVPMGIMPALDLDRPAPMKLEPGDVVGLISDGIYEYQNEAGEQFGNQGVAKVITEHQGEPAGQLIQALRYAVAAFSGEAPQLDDMTIVFVKRLGA